MPWLVWSRIASRKYIHMHWTSLACNNFLIRNFWGRHNLVRVFHYIPTICDLPDYLSITKIMVQVGIDKISELADSNVTGLAKIGHVGTQNLTAFPSSLAITFYSTAVWLVCSKFMYKLQNGNVLWVIPCQISKEFWVTSWILTKLAIGVFVVPMVLTTHTNF